MSKTSLLSVNVLKVTIALNVVRKLWNAPTGPQAKLSSPAAAIAVAVGSRHPLPDSKKLMVLR